MKNILVATDFSQAAALALQQGQCLAERCGDDATLHVLHVVRDLSAAPIEAPAVAYERLQADLERKAHEELNALLATRPTTLAVKAEVIRGSSPAHTILAYARQASIDLIVLGTHGRSVIGDFILGSVAQKVIRSAVCPVMTVRNPPREQTHLDSVVV